MDVLQIGARVVIDGVELPPTPNQSKIHRFSNTSINGKIYVNGYEWKNGVWRRTLKALLYHYF